MDAQQWTIYWNEYASDTYLYGSTLIFHGKNDISFENHLMPPGTIIKTWYSKTNFQRHRIEPALPMIDGETEYEVTPHIECPQGGRWLLRLVFLDKYEEEVGVQLIRDRAARFRCPLSTYSYQMQLLNDGVSELRFHYVIIKEIVDENE